MRLNWLQLLSLAICEMSVGVQTLDMRIDGEKPLSLLSPTTSHATANDRSREVCT
ncbi:unnamed protein product [Ectocarpus sp. 13 AM-2016]